MELILVSRFCAWMAAKGNDVWTWIFYRAQEQESREIQNEQEREKLVAMRIRNGRDAVKLYKEALAAGLPARNCWNLDSEEGKVRRNELRLAASANRR